MTSRLRICAVFLLLATSLVSAQEWVEVKSPHFSVFTDGGDKRGREVAERFEQMRAAFGLLFQKMKVNIPVPLQIIAFRRTKELREYAPLWKGKPVEVAGFFLPGEDRNFIAIDLSSDNWAVVFHEYAHLLINGNLPATPAWYDEGFAEYCSTLVVSKKEIEFGRMPQDRAQVLANKPWMHVEDLFSVTRNSPDYNEGDRSSVFYAQSALVVNYLMGNRRNPQIAQYLHLTEEEHVPVAQAIKQAFGIEPKEFDRILRDYFRGRYTFFRVPAPAGFAAGPFQSRALDELEWQTVLADVHFHSLDYRDKGVAEFRGILEKQPDNAAANRGLGYAYLMQRDFEKAAQHFRLAARDSKDSRVHYLNALLITRRVMSSRLVGEDLITVRRELETAISLAPNFADPYNLLAFADISAGNMDAGLGNIRKAIELDPRNLSYQANLARYEMAADHWDAAEKIWNKLLTSDNPEISREAGSMLNVIGEHRFSARQRVDPPAEQPSQVLATRAPQSESTKGPQPEPEEPPAINPPPPQQSIRFIKGKLLSVDCAQQPGAVLNIRAGGNDLLMFTTDTRTVLLIGVDAFSCDWKERKVSINYRLKPDGRGEIVSLEID
jgi:tetratricopeptide (TPR) repeat protein